MSQSIDFSALFDELEEGHAFITPERTITAADVDDFAALTGDGHPQHLDPAWAAESPFGERIAHGLLIVSLAGGLVPFDPERVVALRRVGDVVFKRPVHLGDAIAVHGKVESVSRIDEGNGLVALSWTIVNQHGQTVARARVEVLWRAESTVLIPI